MEFAALKAIAEERGFTVTESKIREPRKTKGGFGASGKLVSVAVIYRRFLGPRGGRKIEGFQVDVARGTGYVRGSSFPMTLSFEQIGSMLRGEKPVLTTEQIVMVAEHRAFAEELREIVESALGSMAAGEERLARLRMGRRS